MCRDRDTERALADLAERVGAEVRVQYGAHHTKVHFIFEGRSRFNVIAKTSSDWRGKQNSLAQAKRTLRSLGASL
jgi:hypothetical protein